MKEFLEKDLVSKYERKLYITSLSFSIFLWIIIIFGTLGIGLIYVGIIALFGIVIHIGFISHVKGNGIKVTEKQFPELDKMKKEIAKEMGFTSYTHMYVVNFDGMLNAFATKLLSRNFIIITASLLESCDNDIDKLKFIIGHELAHIKRGHVKMQFLLAPSLIIPWLGKAYSKACEYTCDNYGTYYGTKSIEKSVKGLSVLSVGGIYSERIDIDAYLEQAQTSNDFWMSLNETKSTHPYLTKRVFNIVKTFGETDLVLLKRNIFGILFAPFTSMWLWIFLIYGSILFVPLMTQFKDIENKAIENLNSKLGIEKTKKTIEESFIEKINLITKKYLEHKNDKRYYLVLYSDGLTYTDKEGELISYPLKVIDYKNNLFYFKYEKNGKDIKGEIKKDNKLLWGFDFNVNKDKNIYEYFDESDYLSDIKNIK